MSNDFTPSDHVRFLLVTILAGVGCGLFIHALMTGQWMSFAIGVVLWIAAKELA